MVWHVSVAVSVRILANTRAALQSEAKERHFLSVDGLAATVLRRPACVVFSWVLGAATTYHETRKLKTMKRKVGVRGTGRLAFALGVEIHICL